MKEKRESYFAREGAALKGKTTPEEGTPFTIEVRFSGGLTQTQKDAFKIAADRWTKVIIGDLPAFQVDGEIVDDLLILAQGADIDGPGMILGQAGPTRVRPGTRLPAKGEMIFDTADLAAMEQKGTLVDVITHEMGHVLGIGTIWRMKKLVAGSGTTTPTFIGANAAREYGILTGKGDEPVPVESSGGTGTAESHWDELVFRTELMSGFISSASNPLSRMTVASLQDLGYTVNLAAAEPYVLPVPVLFDEEAVAEALNLGMMMPSIPLELPEDAAR